MKKLFCLLLCLLLPVQALAAPMRDVQEMALGESELDDMRAWLDRTVRQALPVAYDDAVYVGAAVYSCVEDAGCYVLECDVYLEDGGDTLPRFAPDDALTWLCDATVAVRPGADGYELVSCQVGDDYLMDHMVLTEGGGYAVSLPDFYVPDGGDVYDFSCSGEDGGFVSGIRYRAQDAAGRTLEAFARDLNDENGSDLLLDINGELGVMTAQDSGLYMIVCAGDGAFHTLTLIYPEDREAEFTLYGEFMRNSFVVEGEANG